MLLGALVLCLGGNWTDLPGSSRSSVLIISIALIVLGSAGIGPAGAAVGAVGEMESRDFADLIGNS